MAGAFDPMHKGHLEFIRGTIKNLGLEKVFILIEEKSKHKKSFADLADREKIAELSIKDDHKVGIYPSETPSFPISSTLPKIKSEFSGAQFYLLVGEDVKEHIDTWPNSKELLENVDLVVASRNQADEHGRISSGKVREQLKSKDQKVDIAKEALAYCRQHNLYQ